jgi:ketosteroid isomerase-like protein
VSENIRRIHDYFERCSTADAAGIAATFTDDAVVYDTNVRPVHGAEEIGRWWVRIRDQWQGARWHVDTVLAEDDRAAVEWTMTGSADGEPFTVRGSDHYDFRDGLISQVRQYWTFDRTSPGSELRDFPYGEDDRFTDV